MLRTSYCISDRASCMSSTAVVIVALVVVVALNVVLVVVVVVVVVVLVVVVVVVVEVEVVIVVVLPRFQFRHWQMSNAITNDRFQTQYIVPWSFCAMAISTTTTRATTTATATTAATTTTTTTTRQKKQQQQQPQLENDFSLNKSVDTLTLFSLRLRAGNSVDWFPATVRSDCPGFDATTMPRFRSRISIDAYSQPRFAQTWSLQRYYNATVSLRNFRRRDPKQRLARAWRPSTLLRHGWAVVARRRHVTSDDKHHSHHQSTIITQKTKSYDIERYTIRKRLLHERQQKQSHHHHYHHQQHQRPSNKQHTNNNVFDVLMREKDDGQYVVQYTCINSNTISQATLDARVVTPNTCTDAVYYRYWIISKHWWHVNVINRCLLK